MGDDLAAANVNRSYQLAASSIAIFTVRLLAVASVWFALWLVYVLFVIRYFPRAQTARKS